MNQPKGTMTVEDIAKKLRDVDLVGKFSGKTDWQVFSALLLFCNRRGIRLAVANPRIWPGRGNKRFYKEESVKYALQEYWARRPYTKVQQSIVLKNNEGAPIAQTTIDPSASYEICVHPDGYASITMIKNNNRLIVCATSSEPL